MTREMACGAVLLLSLAACTDTNQPSDGLSNEQRAAARASVDVVRDCDKPWYDTVSASDHTTIIKGMTPIEREVCMEQLKSGHSSGTH